MGEVYKSKKTKQNSRRLYRDANTKLTYSSLFLTFFFLSSSLHFYLLACDKKLIYRQGAYMYKPSTKAGTVLYMCIVWFETPSFTKNINRPDLYLSEVPGEAMGGVKCVEFYHSRYNFIYFYFYFVGKCLSVN